ncbi:MAG: GNAT family N-acetyltransferase [Bacteroidota bacterium]
MTKLENKTISLRAPEPEDLDLLYLWENNTEVWQVSGTLVPFSRYVLKQYLENAGKDIFEMKQLRLIIQLNSNKRPVGAIDLFDFDPHHRRAGIGILVAESSDRRKGYAREALETVTDYCFQALQLHQVYCNIAAGNKGSQKLFTAAGFEVVGEKKEWLKTGDGYKGELLLQLINKQHK